MTVSVLARCVHGLEPFCTEEIGAVLPHAGALASGRRELSFRLPEADPALLRLSTVDDVLLVVGRVEGVGAGRDAPAHLADAFRRMPWPDAVDGVRAFRPVPAQPVVDVVAALEGRRRFNRFAVEQAVGPQVAGLLGGRYLVRTAAGRDDGDPDVTVRLFVRGTEAVVAVRVTRDPLHRRAYKQDTGPGTLHPPVAAAMARLASPRDGETVRDPFCGDGTIAIETALAFPSASVTASDLDPARVMNARRNAGRAGVRVSVSLRDAGEHAGTEPLPAIVVTNPPWERTVTGGGLLAGSLSPFWRDLGRRVRAGGRVVALVDAEHDPATQLSGAGLAVAVAARLRLAGRLCDVVRAVA